MHRWLDNYRPATEHYRHKNTCEFAAARVLECQVFRVPHARGNEPAIANHSAARGEMATRGLYVFKHESRLGDEAALKLLDRIKANKTKDVPRGFEDYEVSVDKRTCPPA